MVTYMGIGNFMQRHEYRSKDGIHGDGNSQCNQELGKTEVSAHQGGSVLHSHIFQKHRGSLGEDNHRHIDTHSQQAPYDHSRNDAECFVIIHPRTDAESDHLAQSSQYGKLRKTHDHAMCGIEGLVPFINGITDKKRQKQSYHKQKEQDIALFH